MKRAGWIILLCALAISSCSKKYKSGIFPIDSQIAGLAMPFHLQGSQSVIMLDDYFLEPNLVDSVSGREEFAFYLDKEHNQLVINTKTEDIPFLSEMKVWIGGNCYSLLLKRSRKVNFNFEFDPKGKVYRDMKLAGEMNDWSRTATPLVMIDGKWQAELNLNPGRYQYILVLDGKEKPDPNNPEMVNNNIGGFNSVLSVGKIGFEGCPRLITRSVNANEITIDIESQPEKIFIFWQNHRLPVDFITRSDNKIEITIPADAEKYDRSFIRIWSFNNQGVSNDLLIPLQKGSVLKSSTELTRDDKEASILYFLMVDRFNNGDIGNDEPIPDSQILPIANYWGGDIAGITQKINENYFHDLGVNAIWLSPITQNPLKGYVEFPPPRRKFSGYHGYWPVTLTTVDHRFGTSAEMHSMVDAAHSQGINILLDFVSNHVHEENQLIKDNPHWATQLNLPDGRKNIRFWDEHRLTTWFDTFLPSFDFENHEVVETISDSALFWITEYNLDGFRHDATKHIPEVFWRTLTLKLKQQVVHKQGKRLFQIGETFGSRELIGSYVSEGQLDGQFDFNLYFDSRSVFALDSESFRRMNQSLTESFSYYGTNHLMGNITGNHDLPRFISFAGEGLRFNEDEKAAAWNRSIKVENPVGYKKLSALTAFIMTIPGVPVIYYGDEIGTPGAGDPDSRRPLKFDNLTPKEAQTKAMATKLVNLRKNHLSLIYGDFQLLHLTDDTWVYSRRYFNELTIVAFNKSSQPATIEFGIPEAFSEDTFTGNFGADFKRRDQTFNLTLAPYSFEVIGNF
ncbi:MAG: alpha-amylase family glycosyl hydrolase [Bacteroidales bacterium]|nr:alpha-amylase family glycosyl hydrolase [Bacteroidales bacterium]MDZ4203441.1 alpha-amylase family glycosyl hydrolase [Bacteroidales bacterium]